MSLPQFGDVDVIKVYRVISPHGIDPFSIHIFITFTGHTTFCTVKFHDTVHVVLL